MIKISVNGSYEDYELYLLVQWRATLMASGAHAKVNPLMALIYSIKILKDDK